MFNKEKSVEVIINAEKCTKCGICSQICPGEYLIQVNSKITANSDSMLGCIQCGHCMMACPNKAIEIKGESISEEHLVEFADKKADYDSLYSLLIQRRSTRKFKQEPVIQEDIDKIITAAATGAIGITPHEVKIIVINGTEKVQNFADDLINSLEKMSKTIKPFVLKLLKPFIGATNYKLFKEFVMPLINETIKQRKKGSDILFYNAPAVVLFYATAICDKEDAIIASTLAVTAAAALNLGTCVIGTVPPSMNKNPKLKAKYGIAKDENIATAFILGHPDTKFYRSITRDFKDVKSY